MYLQEATYYLMKIAIRIMYVTYLCVPLKPVFYSMILCSSKERVYGRFTQDIEFNLTFYRSKYFCANTHELYFILVLMMLLFLQQKCILYTNVSKKDHFL